MILSKAGQESANMQTPNYAQPRMATENKVGLITVLLRLMPLYKKTSLAYLAFVLLGSVIIIFAALQLINYINLNDFFIKLTALFSTTFVVIFSCLVVSSILAISHIQPNNYKEYWSEIGLQIANAISALALTFTLLGISLGIGSLSGQALTPDNIQVLIDQLTQHFSMAFMTTVVGLPTATIIRAIVSVRYQKMSVVEHEITTS